MIEQTKAKRTDEAAQALEAACWIPMKRASRVILAGFPKTFLLGSTNQLCGPNPTVHAPWFGLFPFRSPLLWKSIFLSLPPAT